MKRKRVWIAVAVIAVGSTVGGLAMRRSGDEALEVETASVTRQRIVQKVSATGTIRPRTQVKIAADVSAKITRLHVHEGQWVEKGDLLVELDRERYLAAVENAEASVRSAEADANLVRANLEAAEREFERARELRDRSLQSAADFEAVEAAHQVEIARHASARDRVEQAKATLKQVRDDLAKTTIYAPMSGTISDLRREEGEIAIGSQFQEDVILVISDLTVMEARVNVDENDIVSIGVGQDAEIEVDALLDQVLQGEVYEIASSANLTGTGSSQQKTEFEVKITITDPVEALRPGMTASAEIITKVNENALSVPIQSVAIRTVDQLRQKGEDRQAAADRYIADRDGFVEVVFCVEDGRALAKQVATGIQSDELIEVIDGLSEGEDVVSGSYRAISRDLENGSMVSVSSQPVATAGL
ncbi:MAG: efflux RND transporter periplasmic adaptor subunit [Candidatus Eiseniibacteriota bacterium]|jgi:HlyD family secretion protein